MAYFLSQGCHAGQEIGKNYWFTPSSVLSMAAEASPAPWGHEEAHGAPIFMLFYAGDPVHEIRSRGVI